MEDVAVFLTCIAMSILLQWPAAMVCWRNAALAPWRGVLAMGALLWAWMPAFQTYVIHYHISGDWIVHERHARVIAEIIGDGRFADAMEYFGIGSRSYRFLFGVFYAFTGAPEVVTLAINASLAYCGMLTLLHIICRQTRCERVPLWLILMTAFLPSALFWTPNNLKEGLCLWGICMMLRTTLHDPRRGARESLLRPLVGFSVLAFMRPHFAIAFATAVGLGLLVRARKIKHIVIIGLGAMASLQAFQAWQPALMDEFAEGGVIETMEANYESRNHIGGSAIYHPGGRPIPVVTGLTLIFLRPFPHEISGIAGAIAALEVWFITAICVTGWMKLPSKKQVLLDPFTVTLLAAILFMAFFYSYYYNMGLLVRQRLHVLPAVIALTAIPHLLPRRHLPVSGVSPPDRRPGRPRAVVPRSTGLGRPSHEEPPEHPAPISSVPPPAGLPPGEPRVNFP